MSEKHLTEGPWKTLVAKQGIKDIGLQKALASYVKIDATQEPAKTCEVLAQISELALKLKKACSAKSEVMAHLDEILKEVKKSTPAVEARAKAVAEVSKAQEKKEVRPIEDDTDEEAEAAEFKKDLKKQMVAALSQVKLRAPGEPTEKKEPKPQLKFMAYLAGKAAAVLVSRKVGSATKKLLPEIAGVTSGGKFYTGECIFEKNAHTFVLEAVPAGLAKKLAAALLAETGQKYKTRVRSTDGSTVLDSETDLDPDGVTASAPTPAPELRVLFKQRLESFLPKIKEAITKAHPAASQIKLKVSEAGEFAQKKDFNRATGRS